MFFSLPLTFRVPSDLDREWNRAFADAIWDAALRCRWNLKELANRLDTNANNLGKALRCEPGTSLPTITRLGRAGSEFWWHFAPMLLTLVTHMTFREQKAAAHLRMAQSQVRPRENNKERVS
jgi:hypothetical protein